MSDYLRDAADGGVGWLDRQSRIMERGTDTLRFERFSEEFHDCEPCHAERRWRTAVEENAELGWVCATCRDWFAWLGL